MRDKFDWAPDYGGARTVEANLHSVQFGDGYVQETAKGINNLTRKFVWTFSKKPAVAAQIEAFLEAHMQGQVFDLKMPVTGGYMPVVVKGYESRDVAYGQCDVSVTFERRYL